MSVISEDELPFDQIPEEREERAVWEGYDHLSSPVPAPATPVEQTCEKCAGPLENPLKLAGPYCVNLECSRRGAVILPPFDLSLRDPCPYILNGSFDEHEGARCELIEGHDGKHRAHSLEKTVTWPSTRSRRIEVAPAVAVPAPEDTLDERISAIRQRCEAATPGPWVCEVQIREREETAHYQIRTVEPQPSHPWSPRFLAWMMGGRSIAPNVFKSLSPWQQSNLVDEGLRDDRKVEPDAQFIAHAREDVPWLLAEAFRLRSLVERMEADTERLDVLDNACRAIELRPPGYDGSRAVFRWQVDTEGLRSLRPSVRDAIDKEFLEPLRRLSSDSEIGDTE